MDDGDGDGEVDCLRKHPSEKVVSVGQVSE